MTRQLPLVVVLGATACGKSKLAIELARRFGGEIISADSMQVYRGLDIVTNKVTSEEQSQAKHHMIDFLDPMQRYSVVDFKRKSLDIINDLMSKGSLPIVVGGTNYYIESLVWKALLIDNKKDGCDSDNSDPEAGDSDDPLAETLMDREYSVIQKSTTSNLHTEEDLTSVDKFFKKQIYNEAFGHIASEKLWGILEQVDATAAYLYHPHDKRRIIRCLQIIQNKGRKYTDLLKENNKSVDLHDKERISLGGPLRFNPTCVFWLNCDDQVLLDKILDDRVDEMLNRGLLAELENFHEDHNKKRLLNNEKLDYTKGIFQSIGFKEFHDYLMLESKLKCSEKGNKILKQSIEMMKLSTRRYARYQIKWIKKRLLNSRARDLPMVFKLTIPNHRDSELESKWIEQVREPAFDIVASLLDGKEPIGDVTIHTEEFHYEPVINTPAKYYCEPCDRTFIGSNYIDVHLKSKTHQRGVTADAKRRKKLNLQDTNSST